MRVADRDGQGDMMTDFRDKIINNLEQFPKIVENPEKVSGINRILSELDAAGFGNLVRNFCSQAKSDRARDFLFEAWICLMLHRNHRIKGLVYEPPERIPKPPDFHFELEGVSFDVQVKRLCNIKNEETKQLFGRELRKRLSRIKKPWFINYWVSDEFLRQHINDFLSDLIKSIESCTLQDINPANQYYWQRDGCTLVRYSFHAKNSGKPGIVPGVIGMAEWENVEEIRSAIERQIKKSSPTFQHPVSNTQSNIVILQTNGYVSIEDDIMDDALYGDDCVVSKQATFNGNILAHDIRNTNGLFRTGRKTKIAGIIFVPSSASPIDEQFAGVYYRHPMHIESIKAHPKPFESMKYRILPKWRQPSGWYDVKVEKPQLPE